MSSTRHKDALGSFGRNLLNRRNTWLDLGSLFRQDGNIQQKLDLTRLAFNRWQFLRYQLSQSYTVDPLNPSSIVNFRDFVRSRDTKQHDEIVIVGLFYDRVASAVTSGHVTLRNVQSVELFAD